MSRAAARRPSARRRARSANRTLFFMEPLTGNQIGALVHQRNQTSTENCTWHNFNIVPTHKAATTASSAATRRASRASTSRNPAAPQEIAFADPRRSCTRRTRTRSGRRRLVDLLVQRHDLRVGHLPRPDDLEDRQRAVQPQPQRSTSPTRRRRSTSFDRDNAGPTIDITTPTADADYAVGSARPRCSPAPTRRRRRVVHRLGRRRDARHATTGAHTFTVTAKDFAGNVTTKTVAVQRAARRRRRHVAGTVPATLALTSARRPRSAPSPRASRASYTASTTANVVSTAGDATLSVADPARPTPATWSTARSRCRRHCRRGPATPRTRARRTRTSVGSSR